MASLTARLDAAVGNPTRLESLYREALNAGEAEEFAAEIFRRHALAPDDVLITAWFQRLLPAPVVADEAATPGPQVTEAGAEPGMRRRQWGLAFVLSGLLSVVYVALGSDNRSMVRLAQFWAPAATTMLLVFLRVGRSESLAGTGAERLRALLGRPLVAAGGLMALGVLAMRRAGDMQHGTNLDILTIIHLPALAWLALGWAVLGGNASPLEVSAAVRKSLEAVITAGLFAGAGGALTLMTTQLFRAIGVQIPEWAFRCFAFGGPGLIPVLAVATVYDPDRSASEQRGEHGLARIIFTTGRLFLPLTLLVLVIYLIAIPFRFMEPFRSREVLIAYNAMLFAVIGLLVAATPLRESEVPGRLGTWLRRGGLAVAACTLLVSLHAMTAVLYRTALGGMTVNRLTVIGWNTVNIATLALLIQRQLRAGRAGWIDASHQTFRIGLIGYAAWTLFVVIVLPLMGMSR